MRKTLVSQLKGDEKLAQDIISNSGIVLMSKGTVIKKEYIPRLIDLNISQLYVEDEIGKGIKIEDANEYQIKYQCKEHVKKTLERFLYVGNTELEKMGEIAEQIICDILQEPEVMYNISGVRRKSEAIYLHSVNVCVLAVLISIKMKLPKNKTREIAVGSLLHDIGFNYIPFDYSERDISNLKSEEIKEIKKHVVYGYSIVENENWLSAVAKDIIISHHELLDGSGYPFRISSDKIKIGSKIVAVCDEFDRRVYGTYTTKMKIHEAIDYIVSQGGILYDFKVVKLFYESVAAYPNGTTVITNGGEVGIVLRQNKKCPTRPVIRLLSNKNGDAYLEWTERDLTKDLTLFIADTVEI